VGSVGTLNAYLLWGGGVIGGRDRGKKKSGGGKEFESSICENNALGGAPLKI